MMKKWGALSLAILATFVRIIRRGKIIFIRLHAVEPSPQAFVQTDEFEFSDDDDCSSVSSEEEEEGNSPMTSFEDQQDVDKDFRVKGSSFYLKLQWQNSISRHMRRRRSGGERFAWSQFTSSKNVVKLWDSLGLGLDVFEENNDNDSRRVVSIWDFKKDEKNSNFSSWHWTIPAVASPKMVFTAERNEKGDGVVLGGYDIRMRRRIPAVSAEWCSPSAAVTEMLTVSTGGVEKVYVRDEITGLLTVGDVRNVTAPLENVTDCDGDRWWDADADIVDDEFGFVDGSR
ncbi:hypothetical protein Fot_15672 [Forsythia ovata]|uniref:Uncharacterized protein n=1 Tax=Forsythia ovata TaxID=205694 RepID=A0ABD1W9W2_9LAMI